MKVENVLGMKVVDKNIYFYGDSYIIQTSYNGISLEKLDIINLKKQEDEYETDQLTRDQKINMLLGDKSPARKRDTETDELYDELYVIREYEKTIKEPNGFLK